MNTMSDRYAKIVLTVIAFELLWLMLGFPSPTVNAQSAAIPVILTGVQMDAAAADAMPVRIEGTVVIASPTAIKFHVDGPVPVKSVPYEPSLRPGAYSPGAPQKHSASVNAR